MKEKILAQIAEALKELDERTLESALEWSVKRRKAMFDFRLSPESKGLDSWTLYAKLYDICGGKTWFKIFHEGSTASVAEYMKKNHEATIRARDQKILRQLEKAGVTTVTGSDYSASADGFNGVFFVDTDKGSKRVCINTILAGGYNIQRLHYRVLVSIK